jgi:hypothetical protein
MATPCWEQDDTDDLTLDYHLARDDADGAPSTASESLSHREDDLWIVPIRSDAVAPHLCHQDRVPSIEWHAVPSEHRGMCALCHLLSHVDCGPTRSYFTRSVKEVL